MRKPRHTTSHQTNPKTVPAFPKSSSYWLLSLHQRIILLTVINRISILSFCYGRSANTYLSIQGTKKSQLKEVVSQAHLCIKRSPLPSTTQFVLAVCQKIYGRLTHLRKARRMMQQLLKASEEAEIHQVPYRNRTQRNSSMQKSSSIYDEARHFNTLCDDDSPHIEILLPDEPHYLSSSTGLIQAAVYSIPSTPRQVWPSDTSTTQPALLSATYSTFIVFDKRQERNSQSKVQWPKSTSTRIDWEPIFWSLEYFAHAMCIGARNTEETSKTRILDRQGRAGSWSPGLSILHHLLGSGPMHTSTCVWAPGASRYGIRKMPRSRSAGRSGHRNSIMEFSLFMLGHHQ